jgi:hypothetical protein
MNSDAESPDTGLPRLVVAVTLCLVVLDIVLPLLNIPTIPPSPNASRALFVVFVYVGYLVAQVGLHASLATLARGRVPLRILSVPVLAALMIWNLVNFGDRDQTDVLGVLAGQWITVAIAMLVLAIFGCRLRRYSQSQLNQVPPTRTQFSLRGLAILVTVACVTAGIAVRVDVMDMPKPFNRPSILLLAGLFALQSVLLVACTLVPRRSWLRSLMAVGFVASCGVALFAYGINPSRLSFLLFVVPAVLQLAALVGMRLLGYRLWPLESRPRPAAALAATGLSSSDGPILDRKSSALLDPKS